MSRTGSEIASICARGLAKGKRGVSDEEFKGACASGLNQYEALASYTDVKRKAGALKRRLRKRVHLAGRVLLDEAVAALDELAAMSKPIPMKLDAQT